MVAALVSILPCLVDHKVDQRLATKESWPMVVALPGDHVQLTGGLIASSGVEALQGSRIDVERDDLVIVAVNDVNRNGLLRQHAGFGDWIELGQCLAQLVASQTICSRGQAECERLSS